MAEQRISPTEEIITQCVNDLTEAKKVHHGKAAAIWKGIECLQDVEQYKNCCLIKSREIWDLYTYLDICYVYEGHTKSTLIKDKIQTLCDKEKEMEKKLKEAVKGIKEVKGKLNEVVDEACKLARCVKEEKRCKKGLSDQLSKDKTRKEWEELFSCVEVHAVNCYNDACKAFDAGVDVVGIQTFVDMDSLKTLAADLETQMKTLREDVKAGSAKGEADWKKALEELLAVKGELATAKLEKCASLNARDGIADTIDFLCDEDGCDDFDLTLEEICRKVKENFGEGSEEPEEHEQKKMKTPKKQSRKDSDQENWEV